MSGYGRIAPTRPSDVEPVASCRRLVPFGKVSSSFFKAPIVTEDKMAGTLTFVLSLILLIMLRSRAGDHVKFCFPEYVFMRKRLLIREAA